MKKDRLYFFTLAGIAGIVGIVNICSIIWLVDITTNEAIKAQLDFSKREASQIARLLETQLEGGDTPQQVIERLQRSIEGASIETGFVCMYNTHGIELCHPDSRKIGQIITEENSTIEIQDEGVNQNFIDLLRAGTAGGGMRTMLGEERSEIVYVSPVNRTDWMVASHANVASLAQRIESIRERIMLISGLASAMVILVAFAVVRWIGARYERSIEVENEQLLLDVKNLARLNADLEQYKLKVSGIHDLSDAHDAAGPPVATKKRLLTYFRDELVSIPVEEIACLYTQNSLTYIQTLSGKTYNSNASLDELFAGLDPSMFFRANRQYIISITGIEKIFRYGNSQLKITMAQDTPDAIIISKNRAAEFKEWLNS